MEERNLPTVYLEIDVEDMESGVTAISFVDSPATEVEWMTFSDNKPHIFENPHSILRQTKAIIKRGCSS